MPAPSPLPLLIRQARLLADERRAELAEVARQADQADDALCRHDAVEAAETALAHADVTLRAGLAAWSRHAKRDRARLLDRQGKLQRTRDAATDALRDACAALKRLELAEDARQTELRRTAARRAEARAEETELLRRQAAAPAA